MWSASDRDVAAEKCRQQTGRCSQRSTEPLGCWRWKGRREKQHLVSWRTPFLVPGHASPTKNSMMSIFRSYRGPMGVKAIQCPRRILQELGSTQNFDPSFFSSVTLCWCPGYLKPESISWFLEMLPDWLLHGAGGSNPPETLSLSSHHVGQRPQCSAFRDRVKHWKLLCCNLNSMVHLYFEVFIYWLCLLKFWIETTARWAPWLQMLKAGLFKSRQNGLEGNGSRRLWIIKSSLMFPLLPFLKPQVMSEAPHLIVKRFKFLPGVPANIQLFGGRWEGMDIRNIALWSSDGKVPQRKSLSAKRRSNFLYGAALQCPILTHTFYGE